MAEPRLVCRVGAADERSRYLHPIPADHLPCGFLTSTGRVLHRHLPLRDADHPAGAGSHAAGCSRGDHLLPEAGHLQAGRPAGGWARALGAAAA